MLKHALSAVVATLIVSSAVAADTDHAAIRDGSLAVLERQFGAFRDAAQDLAEASVVHCEGALDQDAYLDVFRSAWLAWAPLDAYQFGPIEQRGAVLTVAFWPDKKGFVGRGVKTLLAQPEEKQGDPSVVASMSAAAQGLPAIEWLLFSDRPACPAIVGISENLQAIADALFEDWFSAGGFADLMRTAGPDNPVFLTDAEVTKLLYTAIDFELTRIIDLRLSRPLGTFDKPYPKRAEAWRASLSLEVIDAQLGGILELLMDGFGETVFEPNESGIDAAIVDVRDRIDLIGAPLHEAVTDPMIRARVEGVLTKTRNIHLQLADVVGAKLGVEAGFSAADGD